VSLRAHCVTDRVRFNLSIDALVERAVRAAGRGVASIQVRERDLPDRDLIALVRAIREALGPGGPSVLVNDRADIALAAGASGVHLRGDSVAGARLRPLVPPGFIIGRSVHTGAEVDAALADGSYDYLMFGTVFPSAGKPPGHRIAGLDALREVCRRSRLPVIAIGGIDAARVPLVEAAGAAGFAGVGMFMYSDATNG
jgi:thiamine-phosphate pyrophosphorylase